ncbi:MAG: hypothetical protein RIR16_400 [Actinomycetota bacterium]|jgi:DNA-binding MarR family transcriptional regulator
MSWTFLTNHGHVLIYLANNHDARLRDIAEGVGVTERSAQAILGDLADAGYVSKEKSGRRNSYRLDASKAFRHPQESAHQIGELLELFAEPKLDK